MPSKIVKREGNKVVIELEIDLDESLSPLEQEELIAREGAKAKMLATRHAVELKDTDGQPIEVNGRRFTSKGLKKKR